MIVKGLDLSKVKMQQQEARQACSGRMLILDGDGPAYRAAAVVKRLDTAIRHFQTAILTELMMTKCGEATVHLTHKRSQKAGRGLVVAAKPYQGNRKGKSKPPLLEPLREAMLDRSNWLPEFTVRMHYDIEADDGMIIQAHQLKEDGVIWSDDKDLRCTPYLYYDKDTGVVQGAEPHGWVALKELTSSQKVIGRGPIFFWSQMLTGDSADNVKGIQRLKGKLCGPQGAYDFLKGITCRDDVANRVIQQYREIEQNVVAEAVMLHLLRGPRDSAGDYLLSFDLLPENRQFVQHCIETLQYVPQEDENA